MVVCVSYNKEEGTRHSKELLDAREDDINLTDLNNEHHFISNSICRRQAMKVMTLVRVLGQLNHQKRNPEINWQKVGQVL